METITLYSKCAYYLHCHLNKPDVWYIVDDQKPKSCNCKMVLICSPQYEYYEQFDKRHGKKSIQRMPVWSWEEINACRSVNFDHLSQEKVLYNKWGGIPKFTLNYANNENKQKELQRTIDIIDDKLLIYYGEIYYDKDIRHRLVHIFTNEKKRK